MCLQGLVPSKLIKRGKLKHLLRILLILTIVGLFLVSASPVFAIDDPNTISINGVYVYRNCQETGDQLYIVDYTLIYDGSNPTETVTEAYLVRLMNGTTELGSVAPYAYYDDGYDRGVAAIYFSAVDAPWWEGSFTMKLEGNPTLTWNATPPSTSVSTFNLWQDNALATTRIVLSNRILWLADLLELAWSVDMVETSASGSYLTSLGEDYFSSVIPNLLTMAPYAFAGRTVLPEVERRDFTGDYADDLETGIIGTPFDFTSLGSEFGVSRGAITAILYYGAIILFCILAVRQIGSYKPIMLFLLPLIILGAFIGVPLVITILFGFASLVMIGFALFYRPASA